MFKDCLIILLVIALFLGALNILFWILTINQWVTIILGGGLLVGFFALAIEVAVRKWEDK